VFFCSETARDRIVHVGLALGDGRLIHAAGGDAVRINRLEDRNYVERLVTARRYVTGTMAPGS
jgi:cell wall-associated NlpC family hydrolase